MGRLINRFKKEFPTFISQISIAVTLLGIVFGLLFMVVQIYENRRGFRTSEIRIGVAPFYINGPSDIEDEYVVNLLPSNKYLRNNNLPYRFASSNSEDKTYSGVVRGLKDEKIHMAFLSMGLYAAIKHNKIGDERFNKDYELIGFIRKNNSKVYCSGIVCRKDSIADKMIRRRLCGNAILKDSISEKIHLHVPIQEYFNEGKGISLILGDDEYSTSCHLLPENWLLDNGINARNNGIKHYSKNRGGMLEAVRENNWLVGFMSDEDFKRNKDTANYRFYPITEVPIPYDAIIVNRKWWNRRGTQTQKHLLEALEANNRLGLTRLDDNNIEEYVDRFLKYIYGGVIYEDAECCKNIITAISIPNSAMDIYKFYDCDTIKSPTPVILYKYIPNENCNRQQFTPDIINIGTATLVSDKTGKCLLKNIYPRNVIKAGTRFIPIQNECQKKSCKKKSRNKCLCCKR